MFEGKSAQTDDPLDLGHVPEGASLVAMAAYRVSRIMRFGLSHALNSPKQISLVTWRIYLGLSGGAPVPQRALVAFTDMEQAQASRALKRLEADGLIRSVQSDSDKRVRLFSLTAKGRAQFEAAQPSVRAYYQAIDAALTPDERAQFIEMSRRVAVATQVRMADVEKT